MEQIVYHTIQKLTVAENNDNLRHQVLLGGILNQLMIENPVDVLTHFSSLELTPPASPITCEF